MINVHQIIFLKFIFSFDTLMTSTGGQARSFFGLLKLPLNVNIRSLLCILGAIGLAPPRKCFGTFCVFRQFVVIICKKQEKKVHMF